MADMPDSPPRFLPEKFFESSLLLVSGPLLAGPAHLKREAQVAHGAAALYPDA